MSSPVHVLVADDHSLVRSGLRLLLSRQPDIRVTAEAGSYDEVLAALDTDAVVDIVLLDFTMPGGPAPALIEDILRRRPDARIVILTMHDDPGYARIGLAAGASGYVVKSAADADLLEAIRTVAAGERFSSIPSGGAAAPGPAAARPGGTPVEGLSEREREVLLLVAEGHTNQQIADRLYVSVKTIESYRARMMAKLGLRDRAELTRFALGTGLLKPDRD